jgi:hypothetical protein
VPRQRAAEAASRVSFRHISGRNMDHRVEDSVATVRDGHIADQTAVQVWDS